MERKVAWKPLESNPEAFNEFAYKLGMKKQYLFQDVFGI